MSPDFDSAKGFLAQLEQASERVAAAQTQSILERAGILFYKIIQTVRQKECDEQSAALKKLKRKLVFDKKTEENYKLILAALNNISDPSFHSCVEEGTEKDDSVVDAFHNLSQVNAAIETFTEDTLKKHPEDRALILAVEDHAATFYQRVQTALIIGGLLASGCLLTVLSHGACATEGLALVTEAIDRLDQLLGHHPLEQHAKQFQENNQRIVTLSKKLTDVEEKNYEALNTTWMSLIQTHCQEQKKSLARMKIHLSTETPHNKHLTGEIDQLHDNYETQEKELTAITENNPIKKTEAIKKIAFAIQVIEKKAIPTIEKVKEALPNHLKSEATGFIDRAKQFYHANKKMCRFAGLVALTVVGTALTIATGGVAGILGCAALGLVVSNSAKSIFHYFKKVYDKNKTPSLVDRHAEMVKTHCKIQEKTLEKIEGALDKEANPAAHTALTDEEIAYQKHIKELNQLEAASENSERKLETLTEIASAVKETDQKSAETLASIKDKLPEDAKKESLQFTDRAKRFIKENKKGLKTIGKTILAVAALTTLTISTGGIGLGIVLGAAAGAALISKGAKAIFSFAKKDQSKKKDESEGEGTKEKATEQKTGSEHLQLKQ